MIRLIKDCISLIIGLIRELMSNELKEKINNLNPTNKFRYYIGFIIGYLIGGTKRIVENIKAPFKVKKFKYDVIKSVYSKLNKENLSFPNKIIEDVCADIFNDIANQMYILNTNEILSTVEATSNRIVWKLKAYY